MVLTARFSLRPFNALIRILIGAIDPLKQLSVLMELNKRLKGQRYQLAARNLKLACHTFNLLEELIL
jgi:hypothetical protein